MGILHVAVEKNPQNDFPFYVAKRESLCLSLSDSNELELFLWPCQERFDLPSLAEKREHVCFARVSEFLAGSKDNLCKNVKTCDGNVKSTEIKILVFYNSVCVNWENNLNFLLFMEENMPNKMNTVHRSNYSFS